MHSPHQRLIRIIRSLPPEVAQNRLLRTSDRELALSMMYLDDNERASILSMVSMQKERRIQEELTLHERLHITYKQYRIAIEHVIEKLMTARGNSSFKSYLRPRR